MCAPRQGGRTLETSLADIVLGLGTSHSPQLSFPPEQWANLGRADEQSPHLIDHDGYPISYADLLRRADPSIAAFELDVDVFKAKFARLQEGIRTVSRTLAEAAPDILIVVGDDQEENIGFDNMPPLLVYWGESIP